jgi:hypothetical protein
MDDRRQILWGLYQDVVTQGRHHETQRLGMTNAVLVTAAAALGLVAVDGEINAADAPAGGFLVVLGIVGALFALKQYERFRMHMAQASQYRKALTVEGLAQLRDDASSSHSAKWSRGWRKAVFNTHLHWWWASIHLVVSALGAVVVVVGLSS